MIYYTVNPKLLVCLACLFYLIFSDTIASTNIDFAASLNQANLPLLVRVEHRSEVNYNFVLVGDSKWNTFPNLNVNFELSFDQFVTIKYHTSYSGSGQIFLYTRLIVDGQENRDFRTVANKLFMHP